MNDPWEAKTDESLDTEDTFDGNLPKDVAKFFDEVKERKWMRGGSKTDWEDLKKLVKKWQKKASPYFIEIIPKDINRKANLKGVVVSYNAKNLTVASESSYYKDLFPNLDPYRVVNQSDAHETAKYLAARSIQLITLARANELNKKENGIAKLEYEILKKGGWLVGFNEKSVVVCFPFITESIMNKIKKMK